jgi:hypothetical protein
MRMQPSWSPVSVDVEMAPEENSRIFWCRRERVWRGIGGVVSDEYEVAGETLMLRRSLLQNSPTSGVERVLISSAARS